MTMEMRLLAVLFWFLIWVCIGATGGHKHGRATLGAMVGLLLGPFVLFLFFWPRGNNE